MYEALKQRFFRTFGRNAGYIFSAPGRTELSGNHTDHQLGRVLAAAVSLDTVAAVAENGERTVRVASDGYDMCEISLDALEARPDEAGTTAALIRGVLARFCQLGCDLRGFDAAVSSTVLPGSGLSSSAAFEVLMGTIVNRLFFGSKASPETVAQIGQYAENVYFGKPCGLMDQMASAVGGIMSIDFADPDNARVTRIPFDISACGHWLCILDSGADHAGLTAQFAAVTEEMRAVSAAFGKERLRQVDEDEFWSGLAMARKAAGDRACLRAMHFFAENRRVQTQVEALERGDFQTFLDCVTQSGRSSWMLVQNVIPEGRVFHQELAFTLALTEKLLHGRGAFRVHGGGFAGTVLAIVPDDMLEPFRSGAEAVLGAGRCHTLSIRQEGGVLLETC